MEHYTKDGSSSPVQGRHSFKTSLEVNSRPQDRLPKIAELLQSTWHRKHGELGWVEPFVHFRPFQGRGDGCLRIGAHGIGRRQGFAFAVLQEIEVNALLP